MSIAHSPPVTTNGLQLTLDVANTKSFAGEPTTNFIATVTWFGDGANQVAFVKESVAVTEEHLKYKGIDTFLWSPGVSNNCYLNGADITSDPSTIWTFSCYVRREDGLPITSLGVYLYHPSTGSALGVLEDVGGGWYRISRSTSGTSNSVSLVGLYGMVTGVKYYLSAPQLEKKLYATPYTPPTTTRGFTIATNGGWVDVSRNFSGADFVNAATADMNNLTMVFSGSGQRATLVTPYTSSDFTTVSIWHRRTEASSSGTWRTLLGTTSTNIHHLISHTTTRNLGIFDGSFRDFGHPPATDGLFHNYTVIYQNAASASLYVDGIFVSTIGTTLNLETSAIGSIGNWSSGTYWAGEIRSVSIYNRALTVSEIKDNFNRGRKRLTV